MGREQDEVFREGSCEEGTERSDSLAASFSVLVRRNDNMIDDGIQYSERRCGS